MRAFIDDTQRMMRRPGLLRATNGAPAPAEMREMREAGASARYDYERSRYQPAPLASAAAYPIPGVTGAAYPQPSYPAPSAAGSLGSATALPGAGYATQMPYALPGAALHLDPEVWLIALPNGAGGMRALEGADRPGAIRVSRPYGHLRTVRPITPLSVLESREASEAMEASETFGDPVGVQVVTDGLGPVTLSPEEMAKRAKSVARSAARKRAKLAAAQRDRANEGAGAAALPAERPAPQIVSAVEVETDAGIFRVERP
ncbi:MAG TPA: hypothetical protein VF739_04110, partial [Ktedonobacterales bacterium]